MEAPILCLLTDFGTRDEYVGAMKGVVLSRAPHARIVDLAHDLPAGDVVRGALALAAVVPMFPNGTVFVAVVDPGVGSSRRPILVDHARATLIGPDNGLLSDAAPTDAATYVLDKPAYHRDHVSATFHGRDVFASVAGHLLAGTAVDELGTFTNERKRSPVPAVKWAPNRIVGEVLYPDRFGNLVTNIVADDLARLRTNARVSLDERSVGAVLRTYSDVASGQPLALVGSTGRVEIAVRDGSAERFFGGGRRVEIA